MMSDVNLEFHMAIAAAADNSYVAEVYHRLLMEGLRLSRISLTFDADRDDTVALHIEKVIADHRAIVAAIETRDAATAESLGATHTSLFRDRVVRNLTYVPADEVAIEDRESR